LILIADAFGVHGAGGTLGIILTAVFASSAINPMFRDSSGNPRPSGALEGNWHQLGNQLAGVVIA
jgi:Amt family ammonium transporter